MILIIINGTYLFYFHSSSLSVLMQIRDFPGAEVIPSPVEHIKGGNVEEKRGVPSSADSFPESLRWLFCASLATSIYCMAVIGMLHKGLDKVDCMRVRKVCEINLRNFSNFLIHT